MINGQLVRINELQHITSSGFIVKLHSYTKLPAEWERILNDFQNKIKATISEDEVKSEVELLQFNTTNRGSFHIPYCRDFKNLNALMKFCVEFCSYYRTEEKLDISYFAGRMNLEQAFLAYASYQQDTEQST